MYTGEQVVHDWERNRPVQLGDSIPNHTTHYASLRPGLIQTTDHGVALPGTVYIAQYALSIGAIAPAHSYDCVMSSLWRWERKCTAQCLNPRSAEASAPGPGPRNAGSSPAGGIMKELTAEQVRDWLLGALEEETSAIMGPEAWVTDTSMHPGIVLKTGSGEWLVSVQRLD